LVLQVLGNKEKWDGDKGDKATTYQYIKVINYKL
jgi:hypothetical protein|tara:strand:- start:545 stop:646 length:102 start_codon:yes stop_codon:yes gene_type:complete